MRLKAGVLIGALLVAVGAAAPVQGAEAVHIEAQTTLEEDEASFTSNLDGCETGTVVNGRFSFAGTPMFGIFNGFKEFSCDGGGSFTIRLQARFDDTGSTGTWAFVGGTYAGSGTLVGIPFPEGEGPGITDIYDGTMRP